MQKKQKLFFIRLLEQTSTWQEWWMITLLLEQINGVALSSICWKNRQICLSYVLKKNEKRNNTWIANVKNAPDDEDTKGSSSWEIVNCVKCVGFSAVLIKNSFPAYWRSGRRRRRTFPSVTDSIKEKPVHTGWQFLRQFSILNSIQFNEFWDVSHVARFPKMTNSGGDWQTLLHSMKRSFSAFFVNKKKVRLC